MKVLELMRGLWFRVFLLFDLFGYGIEWLRSLSLNPLLLVLGWCARALRSALFTKAEGGTKKLKQSGEERNRHCLHCQCMSFFDTFSVVSAIPAHVLALHDGTEKGSEETTELSSPQTGKYETTHSRLAGPSRKQVTAFHGKPSKAAQACVFSKDGSRFAICYVSGKVALWDTDHGTLLEENLLKEGSVSSVSFLGANNSVLLICTDDCNLWKWEIDTDGSNLTKIFAKEKVAITNEAIFSQRSDFYKDGTNLAFTAIINCSEGSNLSVALVDMSSDLFNPELNHLSPVKVERDFVISNAILSPDGDGLLVSIMDRAFEACYCLLWPDLKEHPGYCRKLDKGTIGSWSCDSRYVVTWIMTNKLDTNDEDENSAFIWNVEGMREKLKNSEHSFKDGKITHPFGGNVFWCQVIQDMEKKDRLIMGVIGKTAKFLFIDMATEMRTHKIETGISIEDMIFWNGDAWIQSYVEQRTVQGLSPMGVTGDGSMFGAVLGCPSEIIIWDAYRGVEILKVSPTDVQANQFKGGIDVMVSPSCAKFAIVGSNGAMVFCPSAPSENKKRAKICLETQMIQLDNPHISHDNLSNFKMNFSGDGDSLGVLCIGSSKMQVWNLPQGTSCQIEDNIQNAEGAHIQDFCLSNNGHYLAIFIDKCIHILDCKIKDVAQTIGTINIDSKIASMGIKDDASELVLCMEDGSISWYELSNENIHHDDEATPSTSNIQEPVGHKLLWMERIKSWFKRPRVDVNEPLIHNNGVEVESIVEETSIHIPSRTGPVSYERHVLAEELDEASFQISPRFEHVFRFSDSQRVEVWELNGKTEIKDGVSDTASLRKSSYSYSRNSSISEQVHDKLLSKRSELLSGTSIDLSRKTTLVQSSRENTIVAGNSSLQALSQRRDEDTLEFEYNEKTQEDSHSVYVINLESAEHRRRLSGRNLEPRKGIFHYNISMMSHFLCLGLAISHDGRHVACLAGDFGSKVVVWNVYASEQLLPDYNLLSLTLAEDMTCKDGIKRDILPLIKKFGVNFFNFRHPSGRSILEEAIIYCNTCLLTTILQYVLKEKVKISFLMQEASNDSASSKPCNVIEACIAGRSPKTLRVMLQYLLKRVTHEAEVAKILTDSIVKIHYHYKAIFVHAIRNPRLLSQPQEIKVPESSLEAKKFITNTSDSLNLSHRETKDSWDKALKKDKSETGAPLITGASSTFPYANACKIGVHGLLRDLLINRVHNSAFGSLIVKAVVNYKWKYVACCCSPMNILLNRNYAKRYLVQELYHHVLVSMSFTVYSFLLIYGGSSKTDSEHEHEKNLKAKSISLLVCMVLAAPCLFRELCQCIVYSVNHGLPGFVYWLKSAWNWIEVFSYINVVVVIPLCQWVLLTEGTQRAIFSALVGAESLLLWSRMLFYARPFDHTGPLVVTITAIVREICYFLILALSVMFGFALAFCVLYRHVEPAEDSDSNADTFSYADAHHIEASEDDEEDSKEMHEAFGTFRRSFFTVFRYTFGDVEMDVLYNAPEPVTALILFVLYVVIIAIILLNMLIALMSEKFARINKNRKTQLIEARARAIDDIDSMLSYRRKMELKEEIGKYLHVLTASHRHSRIIKGSSLQKPQWKAHEELAKSIRRDFRGVLNEALSRRDLTTPRIPESRFTSQNTSVPDRPTMDTIQESGVSAAPPAGDRVPPCGIMEPDPYWSDSDITDSEYSDDSD